MAEGSPFLDDGSATATACVPRLRALYHFEHTTMPALDPNSLPDAEFIPITAYILQQNGYAAGSEPLNRVKIGRTLPKP
jgi:hypothetical protein